MKIFHQGFFKITIWRILMSLCNDIASGIQVKIFEDSEELDKWFEETKDVTILDIQFKSMIIIDEIVIRDCYLVIYK
jgi:hypothetical protein